MPSAIIVVLAAALALAVVRLARTGRRLRAVRRQRDLLGAALDDAPSLIALKDADGRYLHVNHAFARFVGRPPSSVRGLRTLDLLPHRETALLEREDAGLRRAGDEVVAEHEFAAREGGVVTLAIRKRRIDLPGGGHGLVVVAHDVSALRRAVADADAARTAAEAAAAAKAVFLATMSHEIRTPLNGVLGMCQLLARTRLDEEQQEYARIVEASGQSLLAVINGILDFSRLESERVELERLPVDPRRLLMEVAQMQPERGGGLAVLVDLDPGLPRRLVGDPARLRQVLVNLVGNAIKFTERGHVLLRAAAAVDARGERLRLEVEDTGCGIPAEAIPRLFQPFVQADPGVTRRHGGTGLGLAICRLLVERMEGGIAVDSRPGRGSRFTVDLPLIPGPAADPPARPPAGTRVLLAAPPGRAGELLARQLSRVGLAVADGQADPPASGAGAPEAAPAALVLDQAHAGPGCGRIAGHLRERYGRRVPVVLLASPAYRDAHPDLVQGCHAVVPRPVDDEALLAVIARLAEADEATPAPGAAQSRLPALDRIPARVLVAEDDPVSSRLASLVLAGFGAQATVVEEGGAVLAAVMAGGFDLVLMDVHLPGIDGFAATAAIRAMESDGRRRLPVVALTASALEGDREACLRAGMDDYLSKPVTIEALAAVLRRWARPAAG